MSLFSKQNMEALKTPLGMNNPVTVQVLGICSALAVTAQLKPAIVMGLSVTIIVAMANVIISLLRNTIPNRIRIIVQLVVVAALVTIVSEILKAFAMGNSPWPSFLDGIGNGLGYAKILVIVAFIRELFGSGCLFGIQVIPAWCYEHGYINNGLMLMPPAALIIVGCIIWYQRARHTELQEEQN